MILGVHCSVSGGLEKSYDEARRLQTDAMQIFTRNQRQWNAKPISAEEQYLFIEASKNATVEFSFSHCSYLINLASENIEIRNKSIIALTDELIRCTTLALNYCVLHPGAAGTQDYSIAMSRIADALIQILANTPDSNVMILLENTAGQGTSVGGSFENLQNIKQLVKNNRIGFCLDTCHIFAAGYDIRTEKDCITVFESFDKICGLENLKVFHLNDSKGDLNSHLDRHENIGKGKLGLEPFRFIMNEFKNIPKVLETPKEENGDEVNLEILRKLI